MLSTKAQEYPTTVKVISLADQFMCANRFFLRAIPPDDMLEVKQIYTEIVIRFNDSIPVELRKINNIGVASDAPGYIMDSPVTAKYLNKEFIADQNDVIHAALDLSALIVNPVGDNWIELQMDPALFGANNYGTIVLWKVDLVHTTEGVRSERS